MATFPLLALPLLNVLTVVPLGEATDYASIPVCLGKRREGLGAAVLNRGRNLETVGKARYGTGG